MDGRRNRLLYTLRLQLRTEKNRYTLGKAQLQAIVDELAGLEAENQRLVKALDTAGREAAALQAEVGRLNQENFWMSKGGR